jgi:hypothetical protein
MPLFDQPEDDRRRLAAILERLRNLAEGEMIAPSWLGRVNDLLHRIKTPGPAPRKDERLAVYQAVRESGLVPPEASFYLIAYTIEWIAQDLAAAEFDRKARDATQRKDREGLERLGRSDPAEAVRITAAVFRSYGETAMADLYEHRRAEYERMKDLGRQYFFEQGEGL